MIKVLLCDDHAMVRRGIRDTISDAVDVQVVGEAGSYPELREQLRTKPCDVLVLDLNMPGRGGLEVLAALKEEGSSVKTLVVSMYPEDQYAIRCLRAGATGYLNKAGDPAELVTAIRTVVQGRKYVTAEVAQMLVDHLNAPESEELHAGARDLVARAVRLAGLLLSAEVCGERIERAGRKASGGMADFGGSRASR